MQQTTQAGPRGWSHASRLVRGAALAVALLAGSRAGAQVVSPAQSLRVATVAEAKSAKPFARFSSSAQRMRDSIVTLAKAQLGRRYRIGGTTPEGGFDCSGLVRYVMSALNVQLPRTAAQQATRGRAVVADTAQLRPGDLLAFGSSKRVSHIGIYIGDGRFIHASTTAGRVIESPVNRPPARRIKPLVGVRRVLADADTGTTR